MSCCCGEVEKDAEEEKVTDKSDFEQEEDQDFGPTPNRGCTDAWCLIVLVAAWVAYIVVTIMGMTDGNPARLYQPRDFSGAYCDVESNWNSGPNLKGFPKQSFTMNVSSVTDVIVKQMMCSSAFRTAMVDGYSGLPTQGPLLTGFEAEDYLCGCCLIPCGACEGSLNVGGDLANPADISTVITSKLAELRGKVSADNLFSPTGANGQAFEDIFNEASLYFNEVCLTGCAADFSLVNGSATAREYVYDMTPDNPLKLAFDTLKGYSGSRAEILSIQSVISSDFKFEALPLDVCPYPAKRCVPMPGVGFTEITEGSSYCTFEMSADVVNALGSAMTDTMEALGIADLSASLSDTVGTWVGDFQTSIDAFLITLLASFLVGFIYMVALRFLVGCCVWISVFLFFLVLCFGGAFSFIKSSQCSGVGIFETGQTMVVGALTTAAVVIENAISQTTPASEELSGLYGSNYTGVQRYSKLGKLCYEWGDAAIPDSRGPLYTATNYPDSNLVSNYCRNPFQDSDRYKAKTIWCFTQDPDYNWQECNPIGQIRPVCDGGYDINSEELRIVLEVLAYILWVLAFIYCIVVCCLTNRIRLAIAVNKVASVFVVHTPMILVLPAVQALVAGLWTLVWGLSAAFLLSQVPDDYVPKTVFATYAEAYGTSDVPGQCTGTWPTGSVWKDEENCELVNGTMACWRCSQPRYGFDWRFAVSFFVYLWNNALNIAIGQIIIAGAVVVWFFTKNTNKGKKNAIRRSLWMVFRYHLGSVAFGAFIVALVQFIRYMLKYYEQQAKAQKNRIVVLILKVLQCLIWCFEKCIKFLNKNAYIQIALKGTNFCTSAKKAFFLILRNALRFGTVAILGSMIHVIGIMFITAGTAVLGYFTLSGLHPAMAPAVPMIIYIILGYVVGRLFTSIFELAVDTTLQCFLCCEEMQIAEMGPDGFVPSQLGPWLDKSQPPEKASEKKVMEEEGQM